MGIPLPFNQCSLSIFITNPKEFLNSIVVGNAAYGILDSGIPFYPFESCSCFSLKTRVVSIIKNHIDNMNYNTDSSREVLLAAIPVDPSHGIGLHINKGEVLIKGQRVKIIDCIDFDMCQLDITHIPNVSLAMK